MKLKSIRAPASSKLSSLSTTGGTSNAGLFNVAKAAGKKYFGTATDNPELTDTAYLAELSKINEFGQLTPVCLHFYRRYVEKNSHFV